MRVGRRQGESLCTKSISRTFARQVLLACGLLMLVAASRPAKSADVVTKVLPAPSYSWTGLYVGGNFGYGAGGFGPGTNPILGQAVLLPPTLTGFVGGFQAGYNFHFSNNVVLGVEADLSVTKFLSIDPQQEVRLLTQRSIISERRGLASVTHSVVFSPI